MNKSKYLTLKLTPDQVSDKWPEYGPLILGTLEPEMARTADLSGLVLNALLRNEMQCWLLYEDGEQARPLALAVTRVKTDYLTGTKTMVLVAFAGFAPLTLDMRRAGLDTLKKYAKGAGCVQLIAYAEREGVHELARQLDAEVGYTLIGWEV